MQWLGNQFPFALPAEGGEMGVAAAPSAAARTCGRSLAALGEGPGPSLEKSHGMEVLAKPWALAPLLKNPAWPSGSSPRLSWLQEVTAAPAVLFSDYLIKNSM